CRALEMARGDALVRSRTLPVREQLLDQLGHGFGIEIADGGEDGAGRTDEVAVAALRLVERHGFQPGNAFRGGLALEPVATRIGREVALETLVRDRFGIAEARFGPR